MAQVGTPRHHGAGSFEAKGMEQSLMSEVCHWRDQLDVLMSDFELILDWQSWKHRVYVVPSLDFRMHLLLGLLSCGWSSTPCLLWKAQFDDTFEEWLDIWSNVHTWMEGHVFSENIQMCHEVLVRCVLFWCQQSHCGTAAIFPFLGNILGKVQWNS